MSHCRIAVFNYIIAGASTLGVNTDSLALSQRPMTVVGGPLVISNHPGKADGMCDCSAQWMGTDERGDVRGECPLHFLTHSSTGGQRLHPKSDSPGGNYILDRLCPLQMIFSSYRTQSSRLDI